MSGASLRALDLSSSAHLQYQGQSMLPTFPERDMLLVDKFGPVVLGREYKVGDIVISRAPYDHTRMVCKRVAAVQGDLIPSAVFSATISEGTERVPAGHVWLLGDNSKESTDSREYGPGKTHYL